MAQIDKYKEWLKRGKEKHEDEVKEKMKLHLKYYRGDQWQDDFGIKGDDKVMDNIIFSNIAATIPSIFSNDPKIIVKAKTPPEQLPDGRVFNPFSAAKYIEILLNYYMRELDIGWQIRRCLFDAEIGPWGIMQIGYSLETEDVEGNELIRKESPYVIRRSPADIIIDPFCTDHLLKTARYVGLRWVRKLADVKKDKRFTGTKDLESNYTLHSIQEDREKKGTLSLESGGESPQEWEFVEGWNIWDKERGVVVVMVESHDKILAELPWGINYEGFPVETLYFHENPDETYPISPVAADIPIQDELNRISSLQLANIRSAAGQKYIVVGDVLPPEERTKLESGPPGTVICLNGGNVNDVLKAIDSANIAQDVWLVRRQLKGDNREFRGISEAERGVASGRKSATEMKMVEQGTGVRKLERRAILEKFIVRIARKLFQVIQQSGIQKTVPVSMKEFEGLRRSAPDKLTSIVTSAGTKELLPWLSLSPEDIAGEYDIDMEVGSTAPKSPMQDKGDAMAIFNALKGAPFVDMAKLGMYLMEKFEVEAYERFLKAPEQIQKEQQQAMQAKQMEVMAPLQMKAQSDMQKAQIRAQVQAAASQLESQTRMAQESMRAKTEIEIEKLRGQIKNLEASIAAKSQKEGKIIDLTSKREKIQGDVVKERMKAENGAAQDERESRKEMMREMMTSGEEQENDEEVE